MDGLDVNETIDNRVAYQPIPDALAEISVETNNYAADVGNVGGAVISSVIKSGANQFHGNAFEYYRNSDFDANTWENNRSGAAKQERKQHIFGGTLGGPIVRNAAVLLRDYQGSRQDAPGFGTASVAPEAWRRGDLSSVATPIRDPRAGLVFPGNQIPVDRFSPTARALLNDLTNYPLPNRNVPGGISGNYVGETQLAIRAHQGDVRLDWSASNTDKFFGRYSFALYEDHRDVQPFPLVLPTSNDQPFYNVGVNWNRIFGSSLVNELLVGFSNTKVVVETFDWAGVGSANALYGIAGGQPIDGLSQIGWGSGLTLPGAIATDSDTLAKTYQINEKATWVKGRHTREIRRRSSFTTTSSVFTPGTTGCSGSSISPAPSRASPSPTSCSTRCPARAAAAAIRTIRGRICRTAFRSSRRTISRSAKPHAQSRAALGLHVAARRAGQSAVEFRSRHRAADLRGGRKHRRARALQALHKGYEPRIGAA